MAFPEPDKVVINYWSVVTGPGTIVGCMAAPGDGDQWRPLPGHPYRDTALMIDLASVEMEPVIESEPEPIPPGPDPDPAGPVEEWGFVTDFDGYRYKLTRSPL